jgi:hypothetical protein
MKTRLFVVTLVAASLMSFGAFAHGHSKGGTNTNIAIIGVSKSFAVITVTQINGSVTIDIGSHGGPPV